MRLHYKLNPKTAQMREDHGTRNQSVVADVDQNYILNDKIEEISEELEIIENKLSMQKKEQQMLRVEAC